jgi:hypothetical protein
MSTGSSPEEATSPAEAHRPPHTWLPMLLGAGAIVLAAGLVVPAAYAVGLLRQVNGIVDELGADQSGSGDGFFDEKCPPYIRRMGGPDRAAARLGLYLRLPRKWTREPRAERWPVVYRLLGYCGRAGLAPLRSALGEKPLPDATAIWALGQLGTEAREVVPELLYIQSVHQNLGDVVCAAVRKIAPEPALLIALLGDEQIGILAQGYLLECGPEAGPELLATLRSADPLARSVAIRALTAHQAVPDAALFALAEALSDPDEGFRREAGLALSRLSPARKEILPALTRALDSRDVWVRICAARLLGGLGPAARSAEPLLRARLNDQDQSVRVAAQRSLAMVAGRSRRPRT